MQIGQVVERAKPVGLLEPLPVPDRPWASISIDFNLRLPKVVELESGCGGQTVVSDPLLWYSGPVAGFLEEEPEEVVGEPQPLVEWRADDVM
ncbi:reverse transcriptase [Cinnamomum micranthum f. kanehirae]|uniref:Reverse transcriptase n=1 Tax=Cinnamomum micranthum f. kanehirae TaxID=337451 RepID=A0A3S3PLN8_9MAGN|nr:reverse transcriptase [Cinnamomum micranthum f. kanehirae]